jgi:hypothetical protein
MNWDQEIEIEIEKGVSTSLTIGEIESILMAELAKDDLEEFAGELIKWVEFSKPLHLVSE